MCLAHQDQDLKLLLSDSEATRENMKKAVLAALVMVLAVIWAPLDLEARVLVNLEPKAPAPTHVVLRAKPIETVKTVVLQQFRTRVPMPPQSMAVPEIPVAFEPLVMEPEFRGASSDYGDESIPEAPREPGGGFYDSSTADLERPIILNRIPPKYPQRGIKSKIQGYVLLEAVLRADGTISDIAVLHGLGKGYFGFEEEAIAALKKWTFQPGTLKGEAVNVKLTLKIDFHLN